MSAHIFSSGSKREASHEVHRHRRLRGHVAHCRARDKRLCFLAPRLRAGAGHRLCLVEDYEAGALSFKDVTSFNLDEYRGLDPQHDQSYRYFMEHNLFSHVDIDPARTHVPDGACPDAAAACAAYEQSIAEAGGLGLQLLGLGHNGHIGFNEPAPEFPKETHCVELTESTINANSRLFDSVDDVPREAYTMGIGTIMAAKEILVVANGSDKADIVRRAFFGPVTPEVPASILQFHPNVTVVVDKEAGALCQ